MKKKNTQQPVSTDFSLGTQQALGIKAARSIHQEEFICPLESIIQKVLVVFRFCIIYLLLSFLKTKPKKKMRNVFIYMTCIYTSISDWKYTICLMIFTTI